MEYPQADAAQDKKINRRPGKAGFVDRGGKGSHRKFTHPRVEKPIVISGNHGNEALAAKGRKEGHPGFDIMNESARYAKIVEWSERDRCYVGSCPGLFYGGCHGQDEQEVFAELCGIVEDTILLYQNTGKRLPPPTCNRDYANRMLAAA